MPTSTSSSTPTHQFRTSPTKGMVYNFFPLISDFDLSFAFIVVKGWRSMFVVSSLFFLKNGSFICFKFWFVLWLKIKIYTFHLLCYFKFHEECNLFIFKFEKWILFKKISWRRKFSFAFYCFILVWERKLKSLIINLQNKKKKKMNLFWFLLYNHVWWWREIYVFFYKYYYGYILPHH